MNGVNMQLCQIPGCHQRGKHWPSCDDDACTGCLPRLATEGLACDWHVERAERQLREIIDFTEDARAVAYGEVRRGGGGSANKPGSRSPGNDDALDALDAVTNALTTLAREIADVRGLTFGSDGAGNRLRASVAGSEWLGGTHAHPRDHGGDLMATVRVETDVEAYPTLVINEVGHDDQGHVIPDALMEALTAAEAAVAEAEAAIMRHIAQQNPDARDIAEWVRDRDNQPRWQAAVDAYAADHPDGPSWTQCADAVRLRYLDEAGYQR